MNARSHSTAGYLHVAVAVVADEGGRILITKRPDHLHQGGLWEFPGGKIEQGESVPTALSRELFEEVGIRIRHARPLIRIPHRYPDRDVLLDVWRVEQFEGVAHGAEGQPLCWVEPHELVNYTFPAANHPIVTAARLPSAYLITPEPDISAGWQSFLNTLESALVRGIRLVQFRAKSMPKDQMMTFANEIQLLTKEHDADLLVNCDVSWVSDLPAGAGLHLSSTQLHKVNTRPINGKSWLAASCHTLGDVEKAHKVGADFVVVSPVKATLSHPECTPLGWNGLRAISEQSTLPIYALGGMSVNDLAMSWANGAQGIAAIRGIWDDSEARWN